MYRVAFLSQSQRPRQAVDIEPTAGDGEAGGLGPFFPLGIELRADIVADAARTVAGGEHRDVVLAVQVDPRYFGVNAEPPEMVSPALLDVGFRQVVRHVETKRQVDAFDRLVDTGTSTLGPFDRFAPRAVLAAAGDVAVNALQRHRQRLGFGGLAIVEVAHLDGTADMTADRARVGIEMQRQLAEAPIFQRALQRLVNQEQADEGE